VYTPDPWDGSNWKLINTVAKRKIESVVLDVDTKQSLLDDVRDFKASKERYQVLSIPWRRGYLLHGKPGNGKTSLALALASEFDYSLFVMQLSSIGNDDRLRALCDKLPENSVLLIEDIDCAKQLNARSDNNKLSSTERSITLSGMLNALDGVTSSEGRIVIMTSNHPDNLDPALIRPGRVDYHISVSTPSPYQVATLFARFYNDMDMGEEFTHGLDYDNLSMAKLQVYFLSHKTAKEAMLYKEELVFEEKAEIH
jgi:chaperone BCS1